MEMDAMPSLRTSNSQMTDMYGSGRVEKYVANGNSGSYPSSAMRDYQAVSGVSDKLVDVAVGGKINRLKKAKRFTDFAVDTAEKGLGLASMAKALGGAKPKMAKAKAVKAVAPKAKMAKGSPEMKAHMAKLRAMRKK
jgi:hypothetical protein